MNEAVWDREKGRLTILEHRHVAMDAQALCEHLDSLVGSQVAEVIMNNHEFRLGKEDAERLRRQNPQTSLQEIIDHLLEADLLSGVGVVKVRLTPDLSNLTEATVEVSEPCVKGIEGASKAFISSYWCGVLSVLFGGAFEATDVNYREDENKLKYRMVRRLAENTESAQ